MFGKIKAVALAVALIVCGANAAPVQIVNNVGVPIAGPAGQLPDAAVLPAGGFFYQNPGGGGILNLGFGGALPGAQLFFCVAGAGPAAQYVAIDFLENRAVRDKLRTIGLPAGIFLNQLRDLQLCVKLHIEEWENNIPVRRAAGLLINRLETVSSAFEYLHDNSNAVGTKLIKAVKNSILRNLAIGNEEITDRYISLRICFHQKRANGNAETALKYLLAISQIPEAYAEERDLVNGANGFVFKFTHHIAKHFCHHTIMNNPAGAVPPAAPVPGSFIAGGIEPPQNNNPYTSLSYDGLPMTFAQALINAQTVYPKAIKNLLKDYNLDFDIATSVPRFTLRLEEKSTKLAQPIKTIGALAKMASYKKIDAVKQIFNDAVHNPEIWYIANYANAGALPAVHLTDGELCIFFNLGVNFAVNQQFRVGSIDGSLFPNRI
jgi:hypothetical protein